MEVFSALWISWRVPVTCWKSGECSWMFGKAGGGLEREIAGGGFSGREVREGVCGGGLSLWW